MMSIKKWISEECHEPHKGKESSIRYAKFIELSIRMLEMTINLDKEIHAHPGTKQMGPISSKNKTSQFT